MHLQRWLTSIIALPLLILLLLKGSAFLFALLILVACLLGHAEYLNMTGLARNWPKKVLEVGLGALLLWSFGAVNSQWPAYFMIICLFVYFLFYLLHFESSPALLSELALSCLGLLYIPFLLGHFIWLRVMPAGQYWVLWLLLVIFAGDTAAFYTGRWLGKRKLYAAVSPGKTLEGSIGGLLASVIVGLGVGHGFFPEVGVLPLLILAGFLAVVGQLGDLFESMLKRRAEVKDAGSLLPGHGGMLDRLDSLLFAGAWLYYLKQFFLVN